MSEQHPQQRHIRQAWSEIKRREDVSEHVDLRTIFEAAADASSLYEAARQARMSRPRYRTVATWFGVAASNGKNAEFPPSDLRYRLEQLEQGVLPQDARAREWLDNGGAAE